MRKVQHGAYEAPAVTELGSVLELTLGACGALRNDGTFHGSQLGGICADNAPIG